MYLAALDKAEAILSDGIDSRDPEWTWWVEHAKIAWHRGSIYAELSECSAGVEQFSHAAELRARRGVSLGKEAAGTPGVSWVMICASPYTIVTASATS